VFYLSLNIKIFSLSSSEDRIRNGAKKLAKARTTTQQGRLDSFFTISHTVSSTTPNTKKAVRIHT
jgi:hypothetical protein